MGPVPLLQPSRVREFRSLLEGADTFPASEEYRHDSEPSPSLAQAGGRASVEV